MDQSSQKKEKIGEKQGVAGEGINFNYQKKYLLIIIGEMGKSWDVVDCPGKL